MPSPGAAGDAIVGEGVRWSADRQRAWRLLDGEAHGEVTIEEARELAARARGLGSRRRVVAAPPRYDHSQGSLQDLPYYQERERRDDVGEPEKVLRHQSALRIRARRAPHALCMTSYSCKRNNLLHLDSSRAGAGHVHRAAHRHGALVAGVRAAAVVAHGRKERPPRRTDAPCMGDVLQPRDAAELCRRLGGGHTPRRRAVPTAIWRRSCAQPVCALARRTRCCVRASVPPPQRQGSPAVRSPRRLPAGLRVVAARGLVEHDHAWARCAATFSRNRNRKKRRTPSFGRRPSEDGPCGAD